MGRYWRIYKTFFVTSFQRELEFRANFFAKILQNLVWIGFFVLVLLVIYRNTESIAGWGRGEALVLAGSVFLLSFIAEGFFMSLMEIPQHVRQGTLDFIVVKPIDTQFWISARRFNFDKLGIFFAGIFTLGIGLYLSHLTPNFVQWIAFTMLIACGVCIMHGFNLMLMTTGVWLVRVDNLWVLSETMLGVARYPLDIYQGTIQRMLTFVIPLAFLATIPARQLTQGVDWKMVLIGCLWAIAFLLFSRAFWRFAMRHYTSASS